MIQKIPHLIYEVASPDGNTLVAHVDRHGGLIEAFEVEPDQIGTPDHEPPAPFEMIVHKPAGEFTEEAGFSYEPVWGFSIHDDACTGFELLAQVGQDGSWREFLDFLYENGLERPH